MTEPIRIANCSGFFGDRLSAAREMVEGGPIDVLTGDWLAELTMLILSRIRAKQPGRGFAASFVTQMEQVMGACLERGIRVVSNAGATDVDMIRLASSDRPSPLNHADQHDRERKDEQHVDEPAHRVCRHDAEQPQNNEHRENGHQHGKLQL